MVSLQKVSMWKKFYVIYSFFFVRKIVAHLVTFIFYCVVLPATVLVPEVQVPKWGAVYIPSTITLLNAIGTPRWCALVFVKFQEYMLNCKIHISSLGISHVKSLDHTHEIISDQF